MRILIALLCLSFAQPLSAKKPSNAPAASVSGEVKVKGRIERLKTKSKRFNPYAGSYGEAKAKVELPQQLLVFIEGLKTPARSKTPAHLGQKGRNFTESIVPVVGGGQVAISNEDTVQHHIRSNGKPWDFNLRPRGPGETVTRAFETRQAKGAGVVPVYCDIHSNMRSHIIVLENPFYQLLPESGGAFELKGLPAGTYTVTAWHPTLRPEPQTVTLKAGEAKKLTLLMLGKED